MQYFWNLLESYGNKTALLCERETISYLDLAKVADRIAEGIPERSFGFLICKNEAASVAGYLACLRKRIIPVLLSASIDPALYDSLKRIYRPQFIWCPQTFTQARGEQWYGGYKLILTGSDCPKTDDRLAILVSTSGSTGSPKLVRLSYQNLQANTESIVEYLNVTADDKAITTLPMSYVYGLSILQTHLMAGAGIILSEKSMFDRQFWQTFRDNGATTFGAVPYIYQALGKLHFEKMDLPSLRYVTQAGGKLSYDLHLKLSRAMREKGKKMIVMYGASEATARISYVPFDVTEEKAGSIGIAIPGGRMELIADDGTIITESGMVGEIVYYGPNVMLGYAQNREDLAKGDEMQGRYATGDLAKRDDDGYYYIAGRKNRFIKVFGNRINLAEVEDLLAEQGYETACIGEEDHVRIYTTSTKCRDIIAYISTKTGLYPTAFAAFTLPVIPRNEAGKIMYSQL